MSDSLAELPDQCRCCLVEENDMIYVFDILDEFDSKICDLIAKCGGVEISKTDLFSKNICGNCLNDLANAARFRERCHKTEQDLQKAAKEVPIGSDHMGDEEFIPVEEILVEQVEEPTHEILKASEFLQFSDEQDESMDDGPIFEYIVEEHSSEVDFHDVQYERVDNAILDGNLISLKEEEFPFEANEITDEGSESGSRAQQLGFVCQQCGASFAMQSNLVKHLESHDSHVCEICFRAFKRVRDFLRHKEIHERSESRDDLRRATMDEPTSGHDSHKLRNPKRNHQCSFCDKTFVSNSALLAHKRTHTDERPYMCKECPKTFRTVGGLELHERRHKGIKPFECDICEMKFTESSNLKVHRMIHTKEKPHVCIVCNKAFARVFLLKIHQRTHTGERPYNCEECGKQFRQQGDLAVHKRIHTGDRPHRCHLCGKGFIKKGGLSAHMKTHTNQLRGAIVSTKRIEEEEVEDLNGDKTYITGPYAGYDLEIFQEDQEEQNDESEIL
ncbi:zinc finger protein 436-like isoform X2 [Uranotaenia lowii]|uniref:zinc finger protein 436-like isoform X2 n=1 Tax=Uranotaenia lowii TaxID=190385 RepID=UPI0024793CBC|nr:zinc finger protein 436-like isoform X2 [Uranotaenia lowii]